MTAILPHFWLASSRNLLFTFSPLSSSTNMSKYGPPEKQGLYDPSNEHDACGVGFICQMKGKRAHEIIGQALTVLVNMDHRGACGCETNTGDGAGILIQLPHKFLQKATANLGFTLPEAGRYGLGMAYLSPNPHVRKASEALFEQVAAEIGLSVLGWRDVPTDNSSLGKTAIASEPFMRQVFVARDANCADDIAFERKLSFCARSATSASAMGKSTITGIAPVFPHAPPFTKAC